jgi:hypothetical protein
MNCSAGLGRRPNIISEIRAIHTALVRTMRGGGAGSRPAGLPLSAIATVRRGASGPSPISFRLHCGKNLPEIKSCKTLSPPQQGLFWNKSSIYELVGGRRRHDDLTSNLFWSDARVDTIACHIGFVASRSPAR